MNSKQQLLAELNRRRSVGCACGGVVVPPVGPLRSDARLECAAQLHSEELARRELLDHVSLSGQSAFDRIRATGYCWRAAAENIASGNADASRTFAQWLHSAGHCRNMMSALYVDIGLGYAVSGSGQPYWTMDLASPW